MGKGKKKEEDENREVSGKKVSENGALWFDPRQYVDQLLAKGSALRRDCKAEGKQKDDEGGLFTNRMMLKTSS
jgi:hypothetical protein